MTLVRTDKCSRARLSKTSVTVIVKLIWPNFAFLLAELWIWSRSQTCTCTYVCLITCTLLDCRVKGVGGPFSWEDLATTEVVFLGRGKGKTQTGCLAAWMLEIIEVTPVRTDPLPPRCRYLPTYMYVLVPRMHNVKLCVRNTDHARYKYLLSLWVCSSRL